LDVRLDSISGKQHDEYVFEKELALIGLLKRLSLRNAEQIDCGTFASFYESQDEQFRVTVNLLSDVLQNGDPIARTAWKLQENKGKVIYSVRGIGALNQ